jgi:hypothetical protein
MEKIYLKVNLLTHLYSSNLFHLLVILSLHIFCQRISITINLGPIICKIVAIILFQINKISKIQFLSLRFVLKKNQQNTSYFGNAHLNPNPNFQNSQFIPNLHNYIKNEMEPI